MSSKCLKYWIVIIIIFFFNVVCRAEQEATFVRKVEWVGKGHWLKADLHVHTRFSDGKHSVAEVVEKAADFGVDVIAITDHSDYNLKAATTEYFEEINAVRNRYPDMIILAGVEWNIPPWGGREHSCVIIHPSAEKSMVMTEAEETFDTYNPLSVIKYIFDDIYRNKHSATLADECLKWLEVNATAHDILPIIIYNHPSRKDANSMENVDDIERWRTVNDLVIGFEGSPGHQGTEPPGAYKRKVMTIDRWDPAAALVGDAWDTLLQKGIDVWAAIANSDFHNADPKSLNDRWPGEFSETWIYSPDKSPTGVMKALRAGSFFGVHAHIVRELEFTIDTLGLSRPASVGEVIRIKPSSKHNTLITVRVKAIVPETDWKNQPNLINNIELISITKNGARVLIDLSQEKGACLLEETVEVPTEGLVLRVRGRRVVQGDDDLMFYSNPIRIIMQ